MGNSNIKPHIDTAEKTGTCQLCKMGLKEFPDEIQKLSKNLRTLDLSENKIPNIPAYIGSFPHLKTIAINGNRLDSLPDAIGSLKKLESLSLQNNSLRSLPDSMRNLSQLRNLSLSGNAFKTVPQVVCHLKNLDVVDLSKNRITEIPASANTCQAIELNLNQNQISRLSDCIADWPRLKVLRVEENCLEIESLTPRIMKNSKIALLAIEGNVFDMKRFTNIDGYDEYMERYTATKKKFN